MVFKQRTKDTKLEITIDENIYFWYKECGKTFEIRIFNNRWNKETLYVGRKIKFIKRRYKSEYFNATIGRCYTGKLWEIFEQVDFIKVIPIANFREEAINIICDILPPTKVDTKYIAFEVMK